MKMDDSTYNLFKQMVETHKSMFRIQKCGGREKASIHLGNLLAEHEKRLEDLERLISRSTASSPIES